MSAQNRRGAAGRSGRRRAVVTAAIVVPLAAAGAVTGVLASSTGSATMRPLLDRPTAYQIVYRVTSTVNGSPSTTWEVLTVHRPFSSSDIVYAADPDTTTQQAPRSATWFDVDTLYTLDGTGTVRRVAGRQPGPSGSDQALGVELDGLGARRLAHHISDGTVAGRSCRVVRFLEPPVGPIRPLSGADHDDLCIDAQGLVLSEQWVLHGKLAYVRTAVRVRLGDVADPMAPTGAEPLPGNGAAPTATPGSDPQAPIAAPPAPAGFRLARTDVFTLPAPSGQGLQARSTVWAFTRGGDVITVEAGVERDGHYPWDGQATPTSNLDLPLSQHATTVLRSDGPEVRVPLGGGRWVRVRGTVPLSVLVSFARQLAPAH